MKSMKGHAEASVELGAITRNVAALRAHVAPAAVMAVVKAATEAWAFVQGILNGTLIANPIGLIVMAIAALVAGIIWVATKTTFFQDLWTSAWSTITSAASLTFDWVKTNWPLLLAIITGPIGLAVLMIVNHWDAIKGAFSAGWNVIVGGASSAINWVVGGFNNLVGFVAGLPGRIWGAASGMWDGIKNSFRGVINWIIGGWNGIHLTLPSIDTHIPGIGKIGGFTMRVPQMPYLAKGGVATGPTVAMLGEAGVSEAVLPFDRATEFADMVAASLNPRASAGAPQEHTTVVNFDGREIYRVVEKYAAEKAAR